MTIEIFKKEFAEYIKKLEDNIDYISERLFEVEKEILSDTKETCKIKPQSNQSFSDYLSSSHSNLRDVLIKVDQIYDFLCERVEETMNEREKEPLAFEQIHYITDILWLIEKKFARINSCLFAAPIEADEECKAPVCVGEWLDYLEIKIERLIGYTNNIINFIEEDLTEPQGCGSNTKRHQN